MANATPKNKPISRVIDSPHGNQAIPFPTAEFSHISYINYSNTFMNEEEKHKLVLVNILERHIDRPRRRLLSHCFAKLQAEREDFLRKKIATTKMSRVLKGNLLILKGNVFDEIRYLDEEGVRTPSAARRNLKTKLSVPNNFNMYDIPQCYLKATTPMELITKQSVDKALAARKLLNRLHLIFREASTKRYAFTALAKTAFINFQQKSIALDTESSIHRVNSITLEKLPRDKSPELSHHEKLLVGIKKLTDYIYTYKEKAFAILRDRTLGPRVDTSRTNARRSHDMYIGKISQIFSYRQNRKMKSIDYYHLRTASDHSAPIKRANNLDSPSSASFTHGVASSLLPMRRFGSSDEKGSAYRTGSGDKQSPKSFRMSDGGEISPYEKDPLGFQDPEEQSLHEREQLIKEKLRKVVMKQDPAFKDKQIERYLRYEHTFYQVLRVFKGALKRELYYSFENLKNWGNLDPRIHRCFVKILNRLQGKTQMTLHRTLMKWRDNAKQKKLDLLTFRNFISILNLKKNIVLEKSFVHLQLVLWFSSGSASDSFTGRRRSPMFTFGKLKGMMSEGQTPLTWRGGALIVQRVLKAKLQENLAQAFRCLRALADKGIKKEMRIEKGAQQVLGTMLKHEGPTFFRNLEESYGEKEGSGSVSEGKADRAHGKSGKYLRAKSEIKRNRNSDDDADNYEEQESDAIHGGKAKRVKKKEEEYSTKRKNGDGDYLEYAPKEGKKHQKQQNRRSEEDAEWEDNRRRSGKPSKYTNLDDEKRDSKQGSRSKRREEADSRGSFEKSGSEEEVGYRRDSGERDPRGHRSHQSKLRGKAGGNESSGASQNSSFEQRSSRSFSENSRDSDPQTYDQRRSESYHSGYPGNKRKSEKARLSEKGSARFADSDGGRHESKKLKDSRVSERGSERLDDSGSEKHGGAKRQGETGLRKSGFYPRENENDEMQEYQQPKALRESDVYRSKHRDRDDSKAGSKAKKKKPSSPERDSQETDSDEITGPERKRNKSHYQDSGELASRRQGSMRSKDRIGREDEKDGLTAHKKDQKEHGGLGSSDRQQSKKSSNYPHKNKDSGHSKYAQRGTRQEESDSHSDESDRVEESGAFKGRGSGSKHGYERKKSHSGSRTESNEGSGESEYDNYDDKLKRSQSGNAKDPNSQAYGKRRSESYKSSHAGNLRQSDSSKLNKRDSERLNDSDSGRHGSKRPENSRASERDPDRLTDSDNGKHRSKRHEKSREDGKLRKSSFYPRENESDEITEHQQPSRESDTYSSKRRPEYTDSLTSDKKLIKNISSLPEFDQHATSSNTNPDPKRSKPYFHSSNELPSEDQGHHAQKTNDRTATKGESDNSSAPNQRRQHEQGGLSKLDINQKEVSNSPSSSPDRKSQSKSPRYSVYSNSPDNRSLIKLGVAKALEAFPEAQRSPSHNPNPKSGLPNEKSGPSNEDVSVERENSHRTNPHQKRDHYNDSIQTFGNVQSRLTSDRDTFEDEDHTKEKNPTPFEDRMKANENFFFSGFKTDKRRNTDGSPPGAQHRDGDHPETSKNLKESNGSDSSWPKNSQDPRREGGRRKSPSLRRKTTGSGSESGTFIDEGKIDSRLNKDQRNDSTEENLSLSQAFGRGSGLLKRNTVESEVLDRNQRISANVLYLAKTLDLIFKFKRKISLTSALHDIIHACQETSFQNLHKDYSMRFMDAKRQQKEEVFGMLMENIARSHKYRCVSWAFNLLKTFNQTQQFVQSVKAIKLKNILQKNALMNLAHAFNLWKTDSELRKHEYLIMSNIYHQGSVTGERRSHSGINDIGEQNQMLSSSGFIPKIELNSSGFEHPSQRRRLELSLSEIRRDDNTPNREKSALGDSNALPRDIKFPDHDRRGEYSDHIRAQNPYNRQFSEQDAVNSPLLKEADSLETTINLKPYKDKSGFYSSPDLQRFNQEGKLMQPMQNRVENNGSGQSPSRQLFQQGASNQLPEGRSTDSSYFRTGSQEEYGLQKGNLGNVQAEKGPLHSQTPTKIAVAQTKANDGIDSGKLISFQNSPMNFQTTELATPQYDSTKGGLSQQLDTAESNDVERMSEPGNYVNWPTFGDQHSSDAQKQQGMLPTGGHQPKIMRTASAGTSAYTIGKKVDTSIGSLLSPLSQQMKGMQAKGVPQTFAIRSQNEEDSANHGNNNTKSIPARQNENKAIYIQDSEDGEGPRDHDSEDWKPENLISQGASSQTHGNAMGNKAPLSRRQDKGDHSSGRNRAGFLTSETLSEAGEKISRRSNSNEIFGAEEDKFSRDKPNAANESGKLGGGMYGSIGPMQEYQFGSYGRKSEDSGKISQLPKGELGESNKNLLARYMKPRYIGKSNTPQSERADDESDHPNNRLYVSEFETSIDGGHKSGFKANGTERENDQDQDEHEDRDNQEIEINPPGDYQGNYQKNAPGPYLRMRSDEGMEVRLDQRNPSTISTVKSEGLSVKDGENQPDFDNYQAGSSIYQSRMSSNFPKTQYSVVEKTHSQGENNRNISQIGKSATDQQPFRIYDNYVMSQALDQGEVETTSGELRQQPYLEQGQFQASRENAKGERLEQQILPKDQLRHSQPQTPGQRSNERGEFSHDSKVSNYREQQGELQNRPNNMRQQQQNTGRSEGGSPGKQAGREQYQPGRVDGGENSQISANWRETSEETLQGVHPGTHGFDDGFNEYNNQTNFPQSEQRGQKEYNQGKSVGKQDQSNHSPGSDQKETGSFSSGAKNPQTVGEYSRQESFPLESHQRDDGFYQSQGGRQNPAAIRSQDPYGSQQGEFGPQSREMGKIVSARNQGKIGVLVNGPQGKIVKNPAARAENENENEDNSQGETRRTPRRGEFRTSHNSDITNSPAESEQYERDFYQSDENTPGAERDNGKRQNSPKPQARDGRANEDTYEFSNKNPLKAGEYSQIQQNQSRDPATKGREKGFINQSGPQTPGQLSQQDDFSSHYSKFRQNDQEYIDGDDVMPQKSLNFTRNTDSDQFYAEARRGNNDSYQGSNQQPGKFTDSQQFNQPQQGGMGGNRQSERGTLAKDGRQLRATDLSSQGGRGSIKLPDERREEEAEYDHGESQISQPPSQNQVDYYLQNQSGENTTRRIISNPNQSHRDSKYDYSPTGSPQRNASARSDQNERETYNKNNDSPKTGGDGTQRHQHVDPRQEKGSFSQIAKQTPGDESLQYSQGPKTQAGSIQEADMGHGVTKFQKERLKQPMYPAQLSHGENVAAQDGQHYMAGQSYPGSQAGPNIGKGGRGNEIYQQPRPNSDGFSSSVNRGRLSQEQGELRDYSPNQMRQMDAGSFEDHSQAKFRGNPEMFNNGNQDHNTPRRHYPNDSIRQPQGGSDNSPNHSRAPGGRKDQERSDGQSGQPQDFLNKKNIERNAGSQNSPSSAKYREEGDEINRNLTPTERQSQSSGFRSKFNENPTYEEDDQMEYYGSIDQNPDQHPDNTASARSWQQGRSSQSGQGSNFQSSNSGRPDSKSPMNNQRAGSNEFLNQQGAPREYYDSQIRNDQPFDTRATSEGKMSSSPKLGQLKRQSNSNQISSMVPDNKGFTGSWPKERYSESGQDANSQRTNFQPSTGGRPDDKSQVNNQRTESNEFLNQQGAPREFSGSQLGKSTPSNAHTRSQGKMPSGSEMNQLKGQSDSDQRIDANSKASIGSWPRERHSESIQEENFDDKNLKPSKNGKQLMTNQRAGSNEFLNQTGAAPREYSDSQLRKDQPFGTRTTSEGKMSSSPKIGQLKRQSDSDQISSTIPDNNKGFTGSWPKERHSESIQEENFDGKNLQPSKSGRPDDKQPMTYQRAESKEFLNQQDAPREFSGSQLGKSTPSNAHARSQGKMLSDSEMNQFKRQSGSDQIIDTNPKTSTESWPKERHSESSQQENFHSKSLHPSKSGRPDDKSPMTNQRAGSNEFLNQQGAPREYSDSELRQGLPSNARATSEGKITWSPKIGQLKRQNDSDQISSTIPENKGLTDSWPQERHSQNGQDANSQRTNFQPNTSGRPDDKQPMTYQRAESKEFLNQQVAPREYSDSQLRQSQPSNTRATSEGELTWNPKIGQLKRQSDSNQINDLDFDNTTFTGPWPNERHSQSGQDANSQRTNFQPGTNGRPDSKSPINNQRNESNEFLNQQGAPREYSDSELRQSQPSNARGTSGGEMTFSPKIGQLKRQNDSMQRSDITSPNSSAFPESWPKERPSQSGQEANFQRKSNQPSSSSGRPDNKQLMTNQRAGSNEFLNQQGAPREYSDSQLGKNQPLGTRTTSEGKMSSSPKIGQLKRQNDSDQISSTIPDNNKGFTGSWPKERHSESIQEENFDGKNLQSSNSGRPDSKSPMNNQWTESNEFLNQQGAPREYYDSELRQGVPSNARATSGGEMTFSPKIGQLKRQNDSDQTSNTISDNSSWPKERRSESGQAANSQRTKSQPSTSGRPDVKSQVINGRTESNEFLNQQGAPREVYGSQLGQSQPSNARVTDEGKMTSGMKNDQYKRQNDSNQIYDPKRDMNSDQGNWNRSENRQILKEFFAKHPSHTEFDQRNSDTGDVKQGELRPSNLQMRQPDRGRYESWQDDDKTKSNQALYDRGPSETRETESTTKPNEKANQQRGQTSAKGKSSGLWQGKEEGLPEDSLGRVSKTDSYVDSQEKPPKRISQFRGQKSDEYDGNPSNGSNNGEWAASWQNEAGSWQRAANSRENQVMPGHQGLPGVESNLRIEDNGQLQEFTPQQNRDSDSLYQKQGVRNSSSASWQKKGEPQNEQGILGAGSIAQAKAVSQKDPAGWGTIKKPNFLAKNQAQLAAIINNQVAQQYPNHLEGDVPKDAGNTKEPHSNFEAQKPSSQLSRPLSHGNHSHLNKAQSSAISDQFEGEPGMDYGAHSSNIDGQDRSPQDDSNRSETRHPGYFTTETQRPDFAIEENSSHQASGQIKRPTKSQTPKMAQNKTDFTATGSVEQSSPQGDNWNSGLGSQDQRIPIFEKYKDLSNSARHSQAKSQRVLSDSITDKQPFSQRQVASLVDEHQGQLFNPEMARASIKGNTPKSGKLSALLKGSGQPPNEKASGSKATTLDQRGPQQIGQQGEVLSEETISQKNPASNSNAPIQKNKRHAGRMNQSQGNIVIDCADGQMTSENTRGFDSQPFKSSQSFYPISNDEFATPNQEYGYQDYKGKNVQRKPLNSSQFKGSKGQPGSIVQSEYEIGDLKSSQGAIVGESQQMNANEKNSGMPSSLVNSKGAGSTPTRYAYSSEPTSKQSSAPTSEFIIEDVPQGQPRKPNEEYLQASSQEPLGNHERRGSQAGKDANGPSRGTLSLNYSKFLSSNKPHQEEGQESDSSGRNRILALGEIDHKLSQYGEGYRPVDADANSNEDSSLRNLPQRRISMADGTNEQSGKQKMWQSLISPTGSQAFRPNSLTAGLKPAVEGQGQSLSSFANRKSLHDILSNSSQKYHQKNLDQSLQSPNTYSLNIDALSESRRGSKSGLAEEALQANTRDRKLFSSVILSERDIELKGGQPLYSPTSSYFLSPGSIHFNKDTPSTNAMSRKKFPSHLSLSHSLQQSMSNGIPRPESTKNSGKAQTTTDQRRISDPSKSTWNPSGVRPRQTNSVQSLNDQDYQTDRKEANPHLCPDKLCELCGKEIVSAKKNKLAVKKRNSDTAVGESDPNEDFKQMFYEAVQRKKSQYFQNPQAP